MEQAIFVILAALLTSCGGGGGSGEISTAENPHLACFGDSIARRAGQANRQEHGDTCAMIAKTIDATWENHGIGGATSAEILAFMEAQPRVEATHVALMVGRNDIRETAGITVEQSNTNLDEIVRLVEDVPSIAIWSVWNCDNGQEEAGSVRWNTRVELNSYRQMRYPDYYRDVRQVLLDNYDPLDPIEVEDYSLGMIPKRLRADPIHLSYAGNLIAAEVTFPEH